MKRLFILIIEWYRKHISPYKAPCCRFTPTCSAYAMTAFEEWGAFFGFWLTLWRLLRCNPLFKGGYNPVPKRKTHRSDK